MAEVSRGGAFTCVRWQVTLCDPVWQVTSRSSEMECHEELYRPLPFTFGLYAYNLLCSISMSVFVDMTISTLSDLHCPHVPVDKNFSFQPARELSECQ